MKRPQATESEHHTKSSLVVNIELMNMFLEFSPTSRALSSDSLSYSFTDCVTVSWVETVETVPSKHWETKHCHLSHEILQTMQFFVGIFQRECSTPVMDWCLSSVISEMTLMMMMILMLMMTPIPSQLVEQWVKMESWSSDCGEMVDSGITTPDSPTLIRWLQKYQN